VKRLLGIVCISLLSVGCSKSSTSPQASTVPQQRQVPQASSDKRLATIQELEKKAGTLPAWEESDEGVKAREQWYEELGSLLVEVSSFRDPRAASTLAMYIDQEEAQEGLIQLGLPVLSIVTDQVKASNPEARLAAVKVLAKMSQFQPSAQQRTSVLASLKMALSDRYRAVREAANQTLPQYGGQSIQIPTPLFKGMGYLPCFQSNYLAFMSGEETFALRFDPNGIGPPQKLQIDDRAKDGLRCEPTELRVLVDEPYPSSFFSTYTFSVSNLGGSGTFEKTDLPTDQPIPVEFKKKYLEQGRNVYRMAGEASGPAFELVTDIAADTIPNRGSLSYLKVTLVQRDSGGVVKEVLLVDDALFEAAD
jgi:hypothetical protein